MTDQLPRLLLRFEGAALAAAALVLYFDQGFPWWLVLVLGLAPDLSLVGYVAEPRVGAAAYDLAHTYALPVPLAALGVLADAEAAIQVGLIWSAHIGVDRALGYGLKYSNAFRETHLQRV